MDHQERHLWEIQWVRDLALLLVLGTVVWLLFAMRAVTFPVLVALALAYAFNPLVSWTRARLRMPRWLTTLLIMLAVVTLLFVGLLYLVPKLVVQVQSLIQSMPGYLDSVAKALELDWEKITQQLQERFAQLRSVVPEEQQGAEDPGKGEDAGALRLPELDWPTVGQALLRFLTTGVSAVGSAIDYATFFGLAVVLFVFSFFVFSWRFDAISDWVDGLLPPHEHGTTQRVLSRMDRAVSAFLRGRLIQALILGIVLSIGWQLCGVPYWLLLGLGCGMLNLVPFAAVVGWPLAVILTWVDRVSGGSGFDWVWVLVMPSIVYIVGQSLDGWVVEPLVQGKATNLDPLSVLLAVVIGGSLAGIIGMLVAIPAAACLKILAEEVALPKLRAYLRPHS